MHPRSDDPGPGEGTSDGRSGGSQVDPSGIASGGVSRGPSERVQPARWAYREGPVTVSPAAIGRFVRRVIPWSLAAAILAGVWTVRTTSSMPRWYEATVVVASSAPERLPQGIPVAVPAPLPMASYVAAVRSQAVAGRVFADEPWDDVLRVTTSETAGVELLTVRVRDGDVGRALERADRLVAALIAWDRSRARDAVVAVVADVERALLDLDLELASVEEGSPARGALEARRASLAAALDGARASAATVVPVASLAPIGPPTAPSTPVAPRPAVLAAAAAVAAGLAVALLVAAWAWRRRVVEDVTSIEREVGVRVLAEFSRGRGRDGEGSWADAAALLRTRLEWLATWSAGPSPEEPWSPGTWSAGTERPRIYLITAARSERRSGEVASALASSAARVGAATLLVDADLRRTRPVRVAGEPRHAYDVVRVDGREHGPPADMLAGWLPGFLEDTAARYRTIVIDAGPVLPFGGAVALVGVAHAVVVAVDAGRSTVPDVAAAAEIVVDAGASNVVACLTHGGRWDRSHERSEVRHLGERRRVTVPG